MEATWLSLLPARDERREIAVRCVEGVLELETLPAVLADGLDDEHMRARDSHLRRGHEPLHVRRGQLGPAHAREHLGGDGGPTMGTLSSLLSWYARQQ